MSYSFLEDYITLQKLCPDSYLASWSAASYWGIMDETCQGMIAFSPSTEMQTSIENIPISIKKIPQKLFVETEKQFDETGFFYVSSPTKTVIDCFLYPNLAGGERQVNHILSNYRLSEFYNQGLLLTFAKRFLPAEQVSFILQFLKEGDFDDYC